MKEIGQMLKEAREGNGVTVAEAAEDLSLRPSQITSIEEGDVKAFKDVYYLKFFIRDYAKYLGLDSEKILDEFNEFIFDYTSRIPLENIEKQNKPKETKKIASPYTTGKNVRFEMPPMVTYIFIGLLVVLIIYLLMGIFSRNDFQTAQINNYTGVDQYELSE